MCLNIQNKLLHQTTNQCLATSLDASQRIHFVKSRVVLMGFVNHGQYLSCSNLHGNGHCLCHTMPIEFEFKI